MDEDKFKEIFVATFLATWCASQYDYACAMGRVARLEKPPVEDALYLAGTAWAEMQKAKPNMPFGAVELRGVPANFGDMGFDWILDL